MTGLVRKVAVLATCGVLFGAAAAMASVPSPGNSSLPTRINLVGFDAGTNLADSSGTLAKVNVTVRDLANNPVQNSTVVLDFSGATSDLHFGSTQLYQGLTTNCPNHTVRALSNAAGVATFVVIGGGQTGAAHAIGATKVYADGVLLGSIGAGYYDEDGASGVTITDLSKWAVDFFGGTNPERSDLDGAGGVTITDLSTWAVVFFAGKSNASAAAYCP